MKKNVLIICIILLMMIVVSVTFISINTKKIAINKQSNQEYERFIEQEIYGTDVITIINKAINSNQTNGVAIDETGKYISNEENSIIVELVMITNEESKETTTYRMETINKVGINQFISNFNTATFKISKVEYHNKTGKISYIEITQQY